MQLALVQMFFTSPTLSVCRKHQRARCLSMGRALTGTSEKGDVYLIMIDTENPLYVRFWSFGNGEPLEIVDAHIVSRHLTEANCKGDTRLDVESNMCMQNCHELCEPTQG